MNDFQDSFEAEERMAKAVNRVLKRLADCGWIDELVLRPGLIDVRYSDLGKNRMAALHGIIVQELHASLEPEAFRALLALLLEFARKHPELVKDPERDSV